MVRSRKWTIQILSSLFFNFFYLIFLFNFVVLYCSFKMVIILLFYYFSKKKSNLNDSFYFQIIQISWGVAI